MGTALGGKASSVGIWQNDSVAPLLSRDKFAHRRCQLEGVLDSAIIIGTHWITYQIEVARGAATGQPQRCILATVQNPPQSTLVQYRYRTYDKPRSES